MCEISLRSMHEKVVCARDCFVWCGVKKKKKKKKKKKNKNKKTNKIRRFSGIYISETTGVISFKFDMQGREYGPTKIYKFERNRPNSFRATIG